MHRQLFIAGAVLLGAGCLTAENDPNPTPTPSATPLGSVHEDVYVTGAFNNRVRVDGDRALIVASGDNRVEIVDLTTCTEAEDSCGSSASAVFPQFSNPWDVTTDGAGMLYATLLFGGVGNGSVVPAGVGDGVLESEITHATDFASPQGALVVGTKLYVGNTALVCDMNGCTWGDAFVTVVDLTGRTVTGTIGPLPFKNPFGLHEYDGKVWVVCTGDFDENFQPASDGGLVAIDPGNDTITGQISLGLVAPGPNLAIVGSHGFLGSSAGPHVYEVDLDAESVVRGDADPIVLSSEPSFSSWVEAGPGGHLFAASFSEDKVYVIDAATGDFVDVDPDTPDVDAFVVGPGGDTPAGPVALGRWTNADGTDYILVLNTLANAMTTIELATP